MNAAFATLTDEVELVEFDDESPTIEVPAATMEMLAASSVPTSARPTRNLRAVKGAR